MDYSSDDALTAIRLRAYLPAGDTTFSDTNLLFLLNQELQAWAVPFLVKSRSAYLEKYVDTALVAGQTEYSIPAEATGGALREVQMVDTAGNLWPLVQLDVKELGPATVGNPWSFFLRGDSIVLPTSPVNTTWSLRITYARTPSECVLKAACAKVATVNSGTGAVTFVSVPGTITPTTAIDWVKGSAGFLTVGTATLPTPAVGVYTFTSLPTGLAVGDYACLTNQAPFPQLPIQVQPVLHQRVAAKVLDMLGDDKAKQSMALFTEMAVDVQTLLGPRVIGATKALRGTLTRGYGRRWGGYWWGS